MAETGYPGEGELDWDFYISDGRSSLAFKQPLASRPSEWAFQYFNTPKPSGYWEFEEYEPTSFTISLGVATEPIKPDELIPEIAEPVRKAIHLAKRAVFFENGAEGKLSADERKVWARAAECTFKVDYKVSELNIVRLHYVYFGHEQLPAISIYRNPGGKTADSSSIILSPEGFIATGGEGLGSDIAFYQGCVAVSSLSAEEGEPDITSSKARCVESLQLLLSIARSSELLEHRDLASMAAAIETLRDTAYAKKELRYWVSNDDLCLQLVRGEGVSPPKELPVDYSETGAPNYIEVKRDGLYVYCSKPDSAGLDIIIESGGVSASPGLRPSGLLSGYLDSGESGNMLSISLTDTALATLPNPDEEKAVVTVCEMAKKALELPEVRKLGKRHIDAFTRLAKRQICIEARRRTTGLSADIMAAGRTMIFRQAVPTSDKSLILRATADGATIDYQVRPVIFGDEESACQLKLEHGELSLITTGQNPAQMVALMKLGAEAVEKLKAEKLMSIPEFAAKQVEVLTALTAKAEASTIRVVQAPGKISLLGTDETE